MMRVHANHARSCYSTIVEGALYPIRHGAFERIEARRRSSPYMWLAKPTSEGRIRRFPTLPDSARPSRLCRSARSVPCSACEDEPALEVCTSAWSRVGDYAILDTRLSALHVTTILCLVCAQPLAVAVAMALPRCYESIALLHSPPLGIPLE